MKNFFEHTQRQILEQQQPSQPADTNQMIPPANPLFENGFEFKVNFKLYKKAIK